MTRACVWVLAVAAAGLVGCAADPAPGPAQFVGRTACAPCHQPEMAAFAGSHHDLAMDTATEATVLGNFNDAEFTLHGVTSHFNRRNGDYFVRTEGERGVQGEFQVLYTFGAWPLQQYLVAYPGGRLQALPLCWDARPADSGGQRWFHLYGQERIAPSDELHWTRVSQNWNTQCAECHSTDLKKNYDPATRTYATTWSEIDVSCEACHGPGSRHVEWAQRATAGKAPPWPRAGLEVEFEKRTEVEWLLKAGDSIAQRTTAPSGTPQVEVCGRCHARRSTEAEYVIGGPLAATHRPSLVSDPLYFADGQIRDEVYEYGSFLQSKMHRAGVECSDCHNVHSGRLRIEGDALCQSCHRAETYASRSHHFHDVDSAGARCVNCHMPQGRYMGVDMRADHSLQVPRPDLTVSLGVPNACNGCHQDRSAKWAAAAVETWYGAPEPHPFATVFAAADEGDPRARPDLERLAGDTSLAAILRASALERLGSPGAGTPGVLASSASHANPLVRAAAAGAAAALQGSSRDPWLKALLSDSVRLVRTQAARALAGHYQPPARSAEAIRFDSALALYTASQLAQADHPTAWMNLGNLYLDLGDRARAVQAFETAVRVDSSFAPAYVNLADALRAGGDESRSREVLEAALVQAPDDAGANHALGLWWVRAGQTDSALRLFERAWRGDSQQARYAYVYAVALHSQGPPEEASRVVEKALRLHPYDRELLEYSLSLHLEAGGARPCEACGC